MRLTLATVLACISAALLAVTAIGQGTDTRKDRGISSVGDGLGGPPALSASVKNAAKKAGCIARSYKSEGRAHGVGSPAYPQTPAVSGTHSGRWADWGVYSEGVPPQYLVHSLEHGGVVVTFGSGLTEGATNALAELYAAEPGFLIIAPRFSSKLKPAEKALKLRAFPERGFVVTSWQRRLVCKKATAKALSALRTYVRAYRGAGPERVDAFSSTQARPDDLPEPDPKTPDPA